MIWTGIKKTTVGTLFLLWCGLQTSFSFADAQKSSAHHRVKSAHHHELHAAPLKQTAVKHHHRHQHTVKHHIKHAMPAVPRDPTVSMAAATVTASPPYSHTLMSSISDHVVRFVRSTIDTLRFTAYKLGGTHFDPSHGVYVLDCSDYVDHVLQTVSPSAYHSLVNSTGSDKPTSQHYYHFFTGLTYKPRHYWNKIDLVKELQPGDIMVFRNKRNSHTGVSGHVMVVMNKPIQERNAFILRVADSARVGHSEDTRLPHTSGIGMGTMQIKVNPLTGAPSAYAWKLGSAWEKHVNFAMARPIK